MTITLTGSRDFNGLDHVSLCQVTVAFFGTYLVELVGAGGVSCISPTLMANLTFITLSMTLAKLFCEAVTSIS